jgi:hypothetical protein
VLSPKERLESLDTLGDLLQGGGKLVKVCVNVCLIFHVCFLIRPNSKRRCLKEKEKRKARAEGATRAKSGYLLDIRLFYGITTESPCHARVF